MNWTNKMSSMFKRYISVEQHKMKMDVCRVVLKLRASCFTVAILAVVDSAPKLPGNPIIGKKVDCVWGLISDAHPPVTHSSRT